MCPTNARCSRVGITSFSRRQSSKLSQSLQWKSATQRVCSRKSFRTELYFWVRTQTRLVDTFYNEVSRTYGMRPEGRIDYSQFGIDPDGKTLYWTPEDKKICIVATRGKFRFLGLATLARRYGAGGTYAVRRSLGLPDYRSGASRGYTPECRGNPPENIEAIELKDLSGAADTKCRRRRNRIEDH